MNNRTTLTQSRQLTKEEAIRLYHSEVWKSWTDEQIAGFQLFQTCLAIPLERFQRAVEAVLGRSVWVHELGSQGRLREEFLGTRRAPTFQEILDLIPEEKRILVFIYEEEKTDE